MGDEGLTLADMIEGEEIQDKPWVLTDNRLNEQQKTICEYYYKGYSQQKIAEIMGLKQSKVSRIFKRIGKILSKE